MACAPSRRSRLVCGVCVVCGVCFRPSPNGAEQIKKGGPYNIRRTARVKGVCTSRKPRKPRKLKLRPGQRGQNGIRQRRSATVGLPPEQIPEHLPLSSSAGPSVYVVGTGCIIRLPPHPRLAQRIIVPVTVPAMARSPVQPHSIGFLNGRQGSVPANPISTVAQVDGSGYFPSASWTMIKKLRTGILASPVSNSGNGRSQSHAEGGMNERQQE